MGWFAIIVSTFGTYSFFTFWNSDLGFLPRAVFSWWLIRLRSVFLQENKVSSRVETVDSWFEQPMVSFWFATSIYLGLKCISKVATPKSTKENLLSSPVTYKSFAHHHFLNSCLRFTNQLQSMSYFFTAVCEGLGSLQLGWTIKLSAFIFSEYSIYIEISWLSRTSHYISLISH